MYLFQIHRLNIQQDLSCQEPAAPCVAKITGYFTSLAKYIILTRMSGNVVKVPEETHEGVVVAERKPRTATARPPLYKVLLINDDYTPMDFVVYILKQVFHKEHSDAIRIMLEVHNRGSGLCGVFTRDVAETKIELATAIARKNEHPLQCSMEKD